MTTTPLKSVPSEAVKRLAGSQRVGQTLGGAALRKMGIVPLDTGDPDFPTPDYICAAAAEAMRQGYTHYPPTQGDVELREALAELLNEQHGHNLTGGDVLVTNGGAGAIFAAVMGHVNPGDQVLLFDPCFSAYDDAVKVAGGESVWVPFRKDNLHLDPEALERAISPRSKMLILNSPCNPTAIVLDREELEAIQDIVLRHNLILLSDEIYDSLVYDGRPFLSALDLPELAERTLLVHGFSKTFAMTGWRLGYLAGKNDLVKGPVMIARTIHSGVNWPTQRAGLVALTGQGQPWQREMFEIYDRRRRMGHAMLVEIPRLHCALPEAAFYFWIKVDTSMPSAQMAGFFREHGVAVRSGSEFGPAGEGYIRLTFAASDDEIAEGIRRIGRVVEKLPA